MWNHSLTHCIHSSTITVHCPMFLFVKHFTINVDLYVIYNIFRIWFYFKMCGLIFWLNSKVSFLGSPVWFIRSVKRPATIWFSVNPICTWNLLPNFGNAPAQVGNSNHFQTNRIGLNVIGTVWKEKKNSPWLFWQCNSGLIIATITMKHVKYTYIAIITKIIIIIIK